jgi:lysozyme family protein
MKGNGMKKNYKNALEMVLVHEGGYVNHPKDPGGATNKGVTQAVYSAYCKNNGLVAKSVKYITDDEIIAIYKYQYWDAIRGDDLPSGLDYAVFDFAVNSGVSRASKYLQSVVGTTQDGIIGARTIESIKSVSYIIHNLCNKRLGFLRQLRIFSTFGRGWTRRVEAVRLAALAMT